MSLPDKDKDQGACTGPPHYYHSKCTFVYLRDLNAKKLNTNVRAGLKRELNAKI